MLGESREDNKDVIVLYPNNIRKYVGFIREAHCKRGTVFRAWIPIGPGKIKRKCTTFDTYSAAFEFIKDFNIEHNLVKNLVIDCGDYFKVSLTKGQWMLVDAIDLPIVEAHVLWAYFVSASNTYYAYAWDKKKIAFHNLIMGHVPSDITIDHRNNKPLDNRRLNLRPASKTIQALNHRLPKNNKTGVAGVSYSSKRRRWTVSWTENKKEYVKCFPCAGVGYEEARRLAIEYRREKETTLLPYREALSL